jgi:DNA replication protein DnaC
MNALPMCNECGGTGWKPAGKGVVPCECKRDARIAALIERARIPKRYEACGFDSFQPASMSVQRASIVCRRFAKEYPLADSGLLLIGTCGVGKTHLAVATLRSLALKGIPILFYDVRDLLKEIQDSYNPATHASEAGLLVPVYETEVLVLDELGAGKPTEWVQETVTHIINQRYNQAKTTIFTSNYLDIQTASHHDETLRDRIGARLLSRLHEMCRTVFIEGEDYRNKINARHGLQRIEGRKAR